jgi:hypothetical protein
MDYIYHIIRPSVVSTDFMFQTGEQSESCCISYKGMTVPLSSTIYIFDRTGGVIHKDVEEQDSLNFFEFCLRESGV